MSIDVPVAIGTDMARDEEPENRLIFVIQAKINCKILNYLFAFFEKCKVES
jgi:hypothetical protein